MFHTPLILLAVAAAAPLPGQPVALQWKLAKGDTFYARSTVGIKQTVSAGGREQDQEQEQVTDHKYKVLEAGPDKLVLEQTVLNSSVKGNLPGAAEAAGRARGAVLTYTLDGRRKVTKMAGYDEYMDKMAGDDEPARKLITGMLPEAVFKAGVEDLFGFLPADKVRAGDGWKRDTKLPMGPVGDFKVTAKYTYAGPADGAEKLAVTADMEYAPPAEDEGLPFRVKGGSLTAEKYEGTILFDPKAGRVKESAVRVAVSGKLTLGIGGNQVEMELKQKITTKAVLSDTPPAKAD